MRLISLIMVLLLVSCGGESHLILTSAKIALNQKKPDKEKAYEKLAKGLYTEQNKDLIKIPEAWFTMGNLHFGKKEYDKMNMAFDKVIEIESSRDKKPFTDKVKKKREKYYADLYNQGREKYNQSVSASDNEKKPFLEDAIKFVSEALKIKKGVESYIILANAKSQLKDDSAIDAYNKAIEIDPKNKDVIFNLANYYFNKKELDKAATYYNKVIEIDPNDVNAYKFKAYSYHNNQKYKEAADAYKAYSEVAPDDVEAIQYLVQMYYLSKQYDASIDLALKLISEQNENESVYDIFIRAQYMKINDAIVAKDKAKRIALLKETVAVLEESVKNDEYANSKILWEALEELYARQGNRKKNKMASKKVKELSN